MPMGIIEHIRNLNSNVSDMIIYNLKKEARCFKCFKNEKL